ncbi:hypothetical protein AVEN_149992-1 [Araneus ventricosus]|uniref:DDE-1 domain-containing protein n=1 Tax=Araneus ventricosus TaxID=182803 RepID=A0A4Y2LRI3_ARAVE|nr:hypothetical protein AVEN_149992-1 [Araneus ventricosus]
MTGNINEKWLRCLGRRSLSNKRKVLLIVDNCSAHIEVSDVKAIRVEFLPPNIKSILSVDSDVICTEEIPDEQIIADIMNEKKELSYFEQEENEITQPPTAIQAAEW